MSNHAAAALSDRRECKVWGLGEVRPGRAE